MKKIYLLLGPKGVGKSFISKLLESEFRIKFFRAEDIWLKLERGRVVEEDVVKMGRKEIFSKLKSLFDVHQNISMESTGTSKNFFKFVDKLRQEYQLVILKVVADESVCLSRVRGRDSEKHVRYELDELKEINERARQVEYEYDFLIENNEISKVELVRKLKEFF